MKIAQVVNWNSLLETASPSFNSTGNTVGDIIVKAIPLIFQVAGFVLFIYLTIGGYQFLTSGGDPKSIETAKKNITYAIVGFIIIFLAYWIVVAMGKILGIGAINAIFHP